MLEGKKKRRIDRDTVSPLPGWEDRVGITPTLVEADSRAYMVYDQLRTDGIHDYYRCAYVSAGQRRRGVFKIACQVADDDLTTLEAERLTNLVQIYGDKAKIPVFFVDPPLAFNALWHGIMRKASVSPYSEQHYSIAEIREAYPVALDPRDTAWMLNRLFECVHYTNHLGFVHGAVFPAAVILGLEHHSGRLADWGYSVVENGHKLTAIQPRYRAWYPPEVFAKQPATPATDIYLAGLTSLYLLGGNPVERTAPAGCPWDICKVLKKCLVTAQGSRAQDAGEIRTELGEVFKKLWGKPVFRPFVMPARA